jgi:hypothetical protein
MIILAIAPALAALALGGWLLAGYLRAVRAGH